MSQKEISVTIKLYSGIHKELTISDYDLSKGITLKVKKGARLKKVLKQMGMEKLSSNIYFCNGVRIGYFKKLKDGDEVSCLKPSGGG